MIAPRSFTCIAKVHLSPVISAALMLIVAALLPYSFAQKPTTQQDPAQKPAKKPRVEEEEEPSKLKSKAPVRLEEGLRLRPGDRAGTELLKEASNEKPPAAISALYKRMAVPHDELTDQPKENWIEPLAKYVGLKPNGGEGFTARLINDQGEFRPEVKQPAKQ